MNKTILITGTSSGFGKAAALKFAENDWNVIATMRSPEKEEVLTKLTNVLVAKLDVQDYPTIQPAIDTGIARFGKIDTLLNNAGYAVIGNFESATREQMSRQFDVNVFGLMEVTKAIIPHFKKNKGGTIINISSVGGRLTLPLTSLYHATKFAVEGFSESLSYELATQNIIVKLIEPGSAATNFVTSIDAAKNPNITDYDDFTNGVWGRFAEVMNKPSTAEEIVEVFYKAATDGTNQLRYVAGEDAKMLINGKQTRSDQDYINWMRSLFMPA